MSRPRNIRKKESQEDHETVQIWSRGPRAQLDESSIGQKESINIEEIQDKITEHSLEDNIDDDDNSSNILNQEEAERLGLLLPDLDTTDDKLGRSKLGIMDNDEEDRPSEEMLLDGDDEELQQWELAQIKKGMSSAGVRPEKLARMATEKLVKDMDPKNKTEFLAFDSLAACQETIREDLEKLETQLKSLSSTLESLETSAAELESLVPATLVENSLKELEELKDLEKYLVDLSEFCNGAMKIIESEDNSSLDSYFKDTLPEYSDAKTVLQRLLKHSFPLNTSLTPLLEPYLCHHISSSPIESINKSIDDFSATCKVTFTEDLRQNLIEKVVMPRVFSCLTTSFDPCITSEAIRVKNILVELEGILGGDNKNLKMFRLILSDLIEEAKTSYSPGSDSLNQILLTQSLLQL